MVSVSTSTLITGGLPSLTATTIWHCGVVQLTVAPMRCPPVGVAWQPNSSAATAQMTSLRLMDLPPSKLFLPARLFSIPAPRRKGNIHASGIVEDRGVEPDRRPRRPVRRIHGDVVVQRRALRVEIGDVERVPRGRPLDQLAVPRALRRRLLARRGLSRVRMDAVAAEFIAVRLQLPDDRGETVASEHADVAVALEIELLAALAVVDHAHAHGAQR